MKHSITKRLPDENLNIDQIQKLVEIGTALSLEKDINKLLEKVVDKARELSNAQWMSIWVAAMKPKLFFHPSP